jgi:NADH:ubiquinone oxidoreductase subunit 3 (subunit A)
MLLISFILIALEFVIIGLAVIFLSTWEYTIYLCLGVAILIGGLVFGMLVIRCSEILKDG